jgi:hypothetical protein
MRLARVMQLFFPFAVLSDCSGIAVADDVSPQPPEYQVFRYNENYSYLSNVTSRGDLFDSGKYVPLRLDDPNWYVTFGGELRERFEGHYDPNFGIGSPGADSYWLQRIRLLTDWHLGQRIRIYIQGVSGLMEGEIPPAPPAERDPIDLEFAFLDVIPYLTDSERLTLRAGRFGLSLGSGRLVDSRPPVNVDFRYDGFELIYSRPLWQATAFITQPAKDSGYINGEDHTTTFWGLYATHWFDQAQTLGLDLYYLGLHRKEASYASGTGDEHRHMIGTREFGDWEHFDWNAEEVLQVGSFAKASVLAWTASLNWGYTWQLAGNPRVGVKTDAISGDTHPNGGQQGTFNPLYFNAGYFNDAALYSPENLIDTHPNASIQPFRGVSLDGGADFLWRYTRNDAVYAVPGNIAIPALRTGSSYVGTALDLNLNWQIQRHVLLQASYVHFLSGSYVRQAGGGDVNYVSTTISFLF